MKNDMPKTLAKPLSEQDIEKIGLAIQQKDPWYYHYFLFALHTGMRRNEILALTWHDVDMWKDREIIVPNSKMLTEKNSHTRRIPLNETLLGLLLDLRSPSRWVFQKTGKRMLGGTVTLFFSELSQELGISINSERIRWTYAHNVFQEINPSSKKDWQLVQKRVGHKDVSTTKNYFQRNLELPASQ